MAWFLEVLLLRTSVGDFGKLLRYLGIRLLMATCMGWNVDQFWNCDNIPHNQEDDLCPYNFKTYMSKKHFIAIMRYLKFTNVERP